MEESKIAVMKASAAEVRRLLEVNEKFGLSMAVLHTSDVRGAVDYIAYLESAASPAAGQAGEAADCVTRESALEAIRHVAESREPGKTIRAAHMLAATPVAATEQAIPEGYVLAPHFRGYARLGIGAYIINHSNKGEDAELVISVATDEQKAGRAVGDLRDNAPDAVVQPETMAVRLRFDNVAGLDALEQQLHLLRTEHFAAPLATPADAGAAHVLPSGTLMDEILALAENGMSHGLLADIECGEIVAKIKAARLSAPTLSRALTDDQIQQVIAEAVRDGSLSWVEFDKDGDGRYTVPALSPYHYQIARAIEREVLARLPTPGAQVTATPIHVGTLSVFEDKDATFGHGYDISTNMAGHKALQGMDGYELYAMPAGQSPAQVTGEPVAKLPPVFWLQLLANAQAWARAYAKFDFAEDKRQWKILTDDIKSALATHSAPADRDAIRDQVRPKRWDHVAYAEDGKLHWVTGRKFDSCELYTLSSQPSASPTATDAQEGGSNG